MLRWWSIVTGVLEGLLPCLPTFSPLPLLGPRVTAHIDLSRLETPVIMPESRDAMDSQGEALQQSLLAIRRVGC